MKLKKHLGIGLSLLLLTAFLNACSSAEPPQDNSSAAASPDSSAQEPEDNSPRGDPVTFTMFNGMAGSQEDNYMYQYVKEQTGINLEVEYAVGDLNTKIGVLIASGDYPDFITGWEQHHKFVDAGAAVPMNDYIERFGDNVKKAYTDQELEKLVHENGNIYFLHANRSSLDNSYAIGGIYIQRRVLEEAGYPKITTLDQCMELLNDYVEKHPTDENGNPNIAFGAVADSSNFWNMLMPIPLLGGYSDDGQICYVNPETLEVHAYGNTEDAKKYLGTLNQQYLRGNLDPEMFTNNNEQYDAKRTTGRILACFDFWWHIQDVQDSLKKQGMQDCVYVAVPAMLEESRVWKDQMGLPESVRDGVSISTSCGDPERAFKLINWILSEEVQKLSWWGIEGQDYLVDENGLFYRTPEMRTQFQDQEYKTRQGYDSLNVFAAYHADAVMSDGNVIDPRFSESELTAMYDDYDREILEAYGVSQYGEMFPPSEPNPWGVAWDITFTDGSVEKIAETAVKDMEMEWFPKLVMAPEGQFDTLWDTYTAEFEGTNYQSIEKLLTDTIRERVAAAE